MLLTLKLNNKSLAAETASIVLWNEDQKRLVHLRWPSHLSLRGQRNVAQREATPLGACRAAPAKSVSRGRAFRQHIRVLAKRSRPPVDSRCAACRPRLTAAQGSEGHEQRQAQRSASRPQQWRDIVVVLDFTPAA